MAGSTSKGIRLLIHPSFEDVPFKGGSPSDDSPFSLLHGYLRELGFDVQFAVGVKFFELLAQSDVVLFGGFSEAIGVSPTEVRGIIDSISQFVAAGGGLLLVSDSLRLIETRSGLNELAIKSGVRFHEYHNYPPLTIQLFHPHYVTANIAKIRVKSVASLELMNNAKALATTRVTRQPVIASSRVGLGRVVNVGDVSLFSDSLLDSDDNRIFVANIFYWLSSQNIIDIENVIVPEVVRWGQSCSVVVELANNHPELRSDVKCILESDADALIAEPAKKERTIPPGRSTRMQWSVRPQILGSQKLRLILRVNGRQTFHFDQLPSMDCVAPGFLSLVVKDAGTDEQLTIAMTGGKIVVEGAFHEETQLDQPLTFELTTGDGLVEQACEPGNNVTRWHLRAVSPGTQPIVLRITETGQALSALVNVVQSYDDRLADIMAAMVAPLDAEIAERLRQVADILSHPDIRLQPFRVMSPDDYIRDVYTDEVALWLQSILVSARRERWENHGLLDLLLSYIAPTYLPYRGSFIPYDPLLASHLARLHPRMRQFLECNLLGSEETSELQIKQNIAAYLLHERYGHGFFYTCTMLGQQLAILQRHRFFDESNRELNQQERLAAQSLRDSSVIVNEGFAAWLELTFLVRLGQEIRPATSLRRLLLLDANGLQRAELRSNFFRTFKPRYPSQYREGLESLEFISKEFRPTCALHVFRSATNIDLGVSESDNGQIELQMTLLDIEARLLDKQDDQWRSSFRLQRMAESLHRASNDAKETVRKQYCLNDCAQRCPLQMLLADKLQWRSISETGHGPTTART